MSEPDDKRELSGLARSIDALFTDPSGAEPDSGADVFRGDELDTGVDPPAEDAPSARNEPSVELLSSGPTGEAGAEGLGRDVGADSWVRDEPQRVEAERTDGPDPDAFNRAVDAFVAGTPGATVLVEELAAGLRERLVLDPLADAVERLLREAGDPPDPTFVDLAGAIINPAVASRIVQRIGHARDDARKAEYTVLCQRLGEIMAKAFRGALTGATGSEARRTYFDILIAMRDTSRPIIEGMVDDENTLLVRSGIAMLGEIGGEGAVELVTSGLAHPDARVRREALLSLAKLGDEGSGALVTGLLEDPEPEVRVAAATAAGALKVDRALRSILALLEAEGDADSALPFIRALGELGDPGAVPAIEKHAVKTLFSKPRTEVRVAAYRALHQIGTPHARDLVQQALSDKEAGVRVAVRGIVGSGADRQGSRA